MTDFHLHIFLGLVLCWDFFILFAYGMIHHSYGCSRIWVVLFHQLIRNTSMGLPYLTYLRILLITNDLFCSKESERQVFIELDSYEYRQGLDQKKVAEGLFFRDDDTPRETLVEL